MEKDYTRICQWKTCNTQLKGTQQKFCSNSCSAKNRMPRKKSRVIKNCLYCAAIFDVVPSRLKKEQGKFCSLTCFHSFQKENLHSNRVSRICPICNKQFNAFPSRILDGRGKYCSRICANKWRGKNKVKCRCLHCQKIFTREWNKGTYWGDDNTGNRGKFCSTRCRTIYNNIKRYNLIVIGEEKVSINWNSPIAYLVGLVASDGCLETKSGSGTVSVSSKDWEIIEHVMKIVALHVTGRFSKPHLNPVNKVVYN